MILLRILMASLIAWLSLGSPAEVSPLPDAPVAVYTSDAPVHNAPGTASASERGPPAAGYADTTHNAVDRWSHGPSARSAGAIPSATYTYDHPVPPVQVAGGTSMTLRRAGATAGLPAPLEPSHVAAKAGALTEREIGTTMDDLLQGANFLKQSKATQYVKPGGFSQANGDFDALAQGVTVIERGGGLRTATLSNGTKINVRPFSSGKVVTLEVDTPGNPLLKIRYEP